MSVVFVLTDKGWKDERSIKPGINVYCFDPSSNSLDLQLVVDVVDVSNYITYKVYNRQSLYKTYVNDHIGVIAVNDVSGQCYPTTISGINIGRSQLIETFIPSVIKNISNNVRQNDPKRNWDHDVKLREIGTLHFDLSRQGAAAYINKWRSRYQRLNAVDYNQALMLQLVALKSGRLSPIEREVGFNVRLMEPNYYRVTDVEKSDSIRINRMFEGQKGVLFPIHQIDGQVMIG